MIEILKAIAGITLLLALLTSPYWLIKGLRALDRSAKVRNAHRLAVERERSTLHIAGPRERAFLKSCTHCGAFGLTLPHRDPLGRTYCSEACRDWLSEGPRTFCKTCIFATTPKSTDPQSIDGFGTTFLGSAERCGECRSVVRRVWVTAFYVPIVPLRKYRVIQISPREFLGRRLRPLA